MKKNNAAIYDPQMLINAGINPVTGLPIKLDVNDGCNTKHEIKQQLRIIDAQDAINRYTWYNVPKGITSRIIERILYFKGQGAFFKLNDKFYFLPYALAGSIDEYGRYKEISPLPFNGVSDEKKPKEWIPGLKFTPVYEPIDVEEWISKRITEVEQKLESSCVLLKDYTELIPQTNISRQILNDTILDIMAECFPYMRTALMNSTGIMGQRVSTENEKTEVNSTNDIVRRAALNGKRYVAVVGNVDFQDLAPGTVAKAEEFLMAMQSLDNYRLSTYGLENGGLFQKRSHMLEAEQKLNQGNVGLVMKDGLELRQEFCNIVNSIWGIGMWVEPSEVVSNIDYNGDGIISGDEQSTDNSLIDSEVETDNE